MLCKPRDRTAAAMPIAAGIDNGADEPSRRISLEGRDLLDQLSADVLRDVFGVGDRTREPPRKAMDVIVVTLQQALECVAISRRGESGEFAIGAGACLGTGRAGRGEARNSIRPRARWKSLATRRRGRPRATKGIAGNRAHPALPVRAGQPGREFSDGFPRGRCRRREPPAPP